MFAGVYSCACTEVKTALCIHYSVALFFSCQLTQTITVYQIKITHFDADLCVFVSGPEMSLWQLGLQFQL